MTDIKKSANVFDDLAGEIARLKGELAKAKFQAQSDCQEIRQLHREIGRLTEALRLFRSLVKEGGVPRYTITPGAALNALLEETVDPLLRKCDPA